MQQRQGMPNRPPGQRPPGQPGQHNNQQGQRPAGQPGRPVGHNPNASRPMNPNAPHSGQQRPQGQPGQPRPNSQGQQKPAGATNGTNGPP